MQGNSSQVNLDCPYLIQVFMLTLKHWDLELRYAAEWTWSCLVSHRPLLRLLLGTIWDRFRSLAGYAPCLLVDSEIIEFQVATSVSPEDVRS